MLLTDISGRIGFLGWPGVSGNTDEMLWAPERLTAFATTQPQLAFILAKSAEAIPSLVAALGEQRLRWLEALPSKYTHDEFTLVHASPGDPWRAPMPNAGDDELRHTYASLDARVLVYGHIHCPYVRRLPGLTVANTGSVSQSYDGDTRASYLVIDGEDLAIRRVEYDVQSEAEEMLHSGMPLAAWMARLLLAGKYSPPD